MFQPFLVAPRRAAVLTDFDGTLAPIVVDPATAAPLPGVPEVLARLARRFAVVGVVSGRPVSYLVDRLGEGLWLAGLYGLEVFDRGQLVVSPAGERWRAVVAETTREAVAELGSVVEDKGLSLVLHHRAAPDQESPLRAWAEDAAARTGLVVRPAKSSVELAPPVETDKGTVVARAAAGAAAACFFGDDVGDLAAFGALDRLAATGAHVVRVAVRGPEAPPELIGRADVVVDGPEGALALLSRLAGPGRRP